jgi:bifunctional non-homologous end joining protein LigD
MAKGSLEQYRKKRDFAHTPEPPPEMGKGPGGRFVVHEHHASRLHYDLRIEMGGVLKSFAVPKGPSLDPGVRRLAVETEDHPVKYLEFQGSIADGNYGAGQMVIWDRGTYHVPAGEEPMEAYRRGKLHLEFRGEKLRGVFMLIHGAHGDRQWLLFKKHDADAKPGWETPRILPYGSRSEKPEGFEIPGSALRDVKDWTPVEDRERAEAQDAAEALGEAPARKRTRAGGRTKGNSKVTDASGLPPGAKKSTLPVFAEPMLATLADEPFDSPDWVFESKFDGWRALARVAAGSLHLISRNRHSLDAMFPELLTPEGLQARSCLIDGEIVALDAKGVPRFQLLQNRLKGKDRDGGGRMVFYAFDLLHLDGYDLTGCSLLERKALLKRILPKGGAWRYSEHFAREGKEVFGKAVKLGLEGVVAKRAAAPYRGGRSPDWLKIKTKLRQEIVIGGYTEPRRSRILFGSLVAGLYRDGKLHFVGHVGGGFNAKLLKEVHGFMRPLETSKCPFAEVPKTNEKVQWVEPKLVAEVEFAEWTEDDRMRQPIFLGLRPDKDPKACVRETARPTGEVVEEAESGKGAGGGGGKKAAGRRAKAGAKGAGSKAAGGDQAFRGVRARRGTEGGAAAIQGDMAAPKPSARPARPPARGAGPSARRTGTQAGAAAGNVKDTPGITHPDKIYWPGEGYTKGDLIAYYEAVSGWILPHLKDRPLILKRFPNGIGKPAFFQHDVQAAPSFVTRAPLKEEDGTLVHYALCQNRESLVWLANMGVIPQNPWLSRLPHPERPDFAVFDLDPQDGIPFSEVCSLALYVKEVLDGLGLSAWAKTSGSRGIHVYVPLKPRYGFDQSLAFAEMIGAYVAKLKPDAFTVERSIKARPQGRIYLDCMQNSRGKSVASVYSVREKPGAPVSAALEWGELKKKFSLEDFNIETMPKRLARKGDLFADVLKRGNAIEGALKKLNKAL